MNKLLKTAKILLSISATANFPIKQAKFAIVVD